MGNRRIEDLTGQTFGLLTVIQRAESRNGRTRWLCRCACGGEKEVAARDLKAGRVKSCGCLRHNRSRQIIDLTGQHFGRLTALEPTDRRDRRGNVYWRCRCECGNEIEATEYGLVSGNRKSCGCMKKENQDKIVDRLHRVDGTCIEFLEKRKYRSDNKSGFRGVFQMPNGRYRVSIGFCGKRIYLGTYPDYDSAVHVRLDAEERIYGEYLNNYRRSQNEDKV